MATKVIEYPTSDGKPMAETDWHRDLMLTLIRVLEIFFAARSRVYVSGNLLLFYEEGNRRKHVAPDVFVVKGVRKKKRPNYLMWLEGKGPDFITELTSKTTRREDLRTKFILYRDVLKVAEYFLFDPLGDYLRPRLQGYRLVDGDYVAIEPVDERLPSGVLGLHLEAHGDELRFYDPLTGRWLPTPEEKAQEAEAARQLEAEARRQAEEKLAEMQQELDRLRRKLKE